jgi:hypothetical protein
LRNLRCAILRNLRFAFLRNLRWQLAQRSALTKATLGWY